MEYSSNELLAALGFWGSLVMTLIIFSGILGDHALARLGQHLLVGASIGYLGVLAIQHVLRPRLIAPLLDDPTGDPLRWIPLGLGIYPAHRWVGSHVAPSAHHGPTSLATGACMVWAACPWPCSWQWG